MAKQHFTLEQKKVENNQIVNFAKIVDGHSFETNYFQKTKSDHRRGIKSKFFEQILVLRHLVNHNRASNLPNLNLASLN